MEADLQSHVAFFLTGKKTTSDLDAIDRLKLRPALFAGYRDLTQLRYDFPLVLIKDQPGGASVESLSGLIDGILDKIARGAQVIHNPDAERAPATAHMFIINPLSGARMDNLFSTHPDTGNRIRALMAMADDGGFADLFIVVGKTTQQS